jgi:aminoglycoside phosphotransferase (APT) family kinase protein
VKPAASAVALAERLRAALASGDFEPLIERYSDAALLDASIAGGRELVEGREAIEARFKAWWPGPGHVVEWSPDVGPDGIAVWFERAAIDGTAVRQRHYLRLRDGFVTRHWIYAAQPRASRDGRRVLDPRLLTNVGDVVAVEPLVSNGWSGNALERVRLADGRSLVAKRLVPGSDWIGRATRDRGREALLWTTGVLERVPAAIDAAVVAVVRDGDAWWVVMRDVSGQLFDASSTLSRQDSRRVLKAANLMWEKFWGERIDVLCSLTDRLGMTAPQVSERERWGVDLLPKQFEMAWEAFAEAADDDVALPVLAIVAEPLPLAAALEASGTTLIHADLRDENMGLTEHGIVLLDWGIATQGHPTVELAWYLMHDAWRIDATHDEVVDDFRRVRGDRDDPDALELGLIAGLVMYGWVLGHSAIVHPDPAERAWARSELDWWIPRVRRAFETWSPPARAGATVRFRPNRRIVSKA